MDFWISEWISGFQIGFLDFTVDFWISADGIRDFFRDGPLVKTRVPAVYLKMTDKTRRNEADSFSEGTFQLSLTRLGSIYTIELVACGI